MDRVEHLILKNLMYNEPFTRKVLPYLQPEYFEDRSEKVLFEEVNSFISTYNNLPTKEALTINLNCSPTALRKVANQLISEKRIIQKVDPSDAKKQRLEFIVKIKDLE